MGSVRSHGIGWAGYRRATPLDSRDGILSDRMFYGLFQARKRPIRWDPPRCSVSGVDEVGDGVEGELVAVEAHAGDGAGGDRGDDRALAELVAGGRVGDVDLHERQTGVTDHVGGVGQRVRVVGERGRVHDDRGLLVGCPVHPVDHLRFVVGLTDFDLETERGAPFGAQAAQLLQILTAVHVGLAHAETAEVRPVDDDDFRGHMTLLLVQ